MIQANKITQQGNKPIITPDCFDRKRVVVDDKPTGATTGGTNGDSYRVKYRYVMKDGSETMDYPRTVLPTMSLVYGSTQRTPEGGGDPAPDTKYGFTLGSRVVAVGEMREPKMHEDANGRFTRCEEYPRTFAFQEELTGNAFRGDDKVIGEEHKAATLAYYKMISEYESEVREQIASIRKKGKKSYSFSEQNMLIRPSTKTPYQDIHAKVCQFTKDDVTRISMRVILDPHGKKTMSFDAFRPKSGGARVSAWLTFPSVHVSSAGIPTVRCTSDLILLKAPGVDPASARESNVIDVSEIPDTEESDPSLLALDEGPEEPAVKRAREPEYVPTDEDGIVFT